MRNRLTHHIVRSVARSAFNFIFYLAHRGVAFEDNQFFFGDLCSQGTIDDEMFKERCPNLN